MEGFKQFILSEEINYNGTVATVYHRTHSIENVLGILQKGYDPSEHYANVAASNYEHGKEIHKNMKYLGLWTSLDLESHLLLSSVPGGNFIIKFKVTDLDKYLVIPIDVAKVIHKENYKLSDQLKKFNISQNFTKIELDTMDIKQKKNMYNHMSEVNTLLEENNAIREKTKGVIYLGYDDNYCLYKFYPVNDETITMLGYMQIDPNKKRLSYDNPKKIKELLKNRNWITSTDMASFKSIQKLPYQEREKYTQIKDPKNYRDLLVQKMIEELKQKENIEKTDIQKLMKSSQKGISYPTILEIFRFMKKKTTTIYKQNNKRIFGKFYILYRTYKKNRK